MTATIDATIFTKDVPYSLPSCYSQEILNPKKTNETTYVTYYVLTPKDTSQKEVTLFDADEFNEGQGIEVSDFIKALENSCK